MYKHQRFIFLIFCLALCLTGVAKAVQVNHLYSGSVPIASQQASDRAEGFDRALLQVIVKVTGNRDVLLQDELIKSLLPGERYVQTFSYRENPEYKAYLEALEAERHEQAKEQNAAQEVASSSSDDLNQENNSASGSTLDELVEPEPFLIDVTFSEVGLKERLVSLNIPIWGRTRPSVLLWLVTESAGERVLLGDGMFESQKSLEDAAYESGVPLFLPVADLIDANAVDVSDLWAMFPGTVEEASRRYRADSAVMMRLYQRDGGDWTANWMLQQGELLESQESSHSDVSVVFKDMVAHIAKAFAERYAVLRSDTLDASGLNVVISNVNNFEDYVLVQRYLSNLPPVSEVRLDWLSATEQAYHLILNSSQEQFFEHLDLGQKLVRDTRPVISEQVSLMPVDVEPEEASAVHELEEHASTLNTDLQQDESEDEAPDTVMMGDTDAGLIEPVQEISEESDLFEQQIEAIFTEPLIRLVWQGNR